MHLAVDAQFSRTGVHPVMNGYQQRIVQINLFETKYIAISPQLQSNRLPLRDMMLLQLQHFGDLHLIARNFAMCACILAILT